jgi:nicotinate phosphoribosyltransferase
MAGDMLLLDDDRQEGEPLLHRVMREGKRLDAPMPPLSALRERAANQLARLPERLRTLDQARKPFKVKISGALQSLAFAVDEQSR